MLQINSLQASQVFTVCSQEITLPDDMKTACASIRFYWAAILEGSGHIQAGRTKFIFEMERGTKKTFGGWDWSVYESFEFFEPDDGGDWVDIKNTGNPFGDPRWFKSGNASYSIGRMKPGEKLRIKFIAEDCTAGGHAGVVFIDDVALNTACEDVPAHNDPISYGPLPNVFSPNDDGDNDIWGISDVKNACLVEFTVFNRWGNEIFHSRKVSPDGTWPDFLEIWDGTVRPRGRGGCLGCSQQVERKIRQRDMDNGVVLFTLKIENCHETREESGSIHIFL